MKRRTFLTGLAPVLVAGTAWAQGAQAPAAGPRGPAWQGEAERTFRMGRGMASQLMTEEEWREHQRKMRTLTPEEREQYRRQVHERMMERAREQGMAMPRMPEDRGPGPGPGPGGGTGPRGGRGR